MLVCVTGATGLVGSAVTSELTAAGHRVQKLSHRANSPGAAYWNPATGEIDAAALRGVDAVVHLAGENIATGRWTAAKKQRIRESRVAGTRLLCETLTGLEVRPRVLVSASAIGYYGSRGDELVDESSANGTGFLAEVCRDWEAATAAAQASGIRVVHLRIGVVLSSRGGALTAMLRPFRLGLGGRVGSGRQWMSWIELHDVAGAVLHCLTREDLTGPVNCVAPQPVTNAEFTRTLAETLHRPAILPLPSIAVRVGLGEMADELLLSSTRVEPRRLKETGYVFRYPDLASALKSILRS